MIDRDLANRPPAEELWIWRRSRGMTQRRAAAALGVGRGRLSRAERDGDLGGPHGPWKPVRPVPTPILLALARRRSGMTLRGAAAAVGISHRTLLLWERAGAEALVEWWVRRGYRFPAA